MIDPTDSAKIILNLIKADLALGREPQALALLRRALITRRRGNIIG